MTTHPAEMLAQTLGSVVEEQVQFREEVTLVVARAGILEALGAARDAGFTVLTDLTAVDRHPAEPRFEVVYLLTALDLRARVRMKARLPGADPVIASATALWPAADWLEREVFDLFGIRFAGHPDLRRILLPDEWEGYPLRKDFPLVEEPVQFVDHTPKVPSEIIPRTRPKRP